MWIQQHGDDMKMFTNGDACASMEDFLHDNKHDDDVCNWIKNANIGDSISFGTCGDLHCIDVSGVMVRDKHTYCLCGNNSWSDNWLFDESTCVATCKCCDRKWWIEL